MRITIRLAVLVTLALCLSAGMGRAETPEKASYHAKPHYGYPVDWSSRQLVLAGASAQAALDAGQAEPRHVYNMVRRMAAVEREKRRHHRRRERHSMKIDWAVSLANGYVSQSQYPAKYSFQVNSDDCNKDYVLFALTLASGAGAQANVVGINNLYTGGTLNCNSGTPWVAFAYNTLTQTSGHILTSPTLSDDGAKVAFVESSAAGSYFHVLVLPNPIPTPPSQAGSVLSPQTPTACPAPTTVGCMTTVQISTATNTLASPWIDYTNDTAYVGTNDGKLYKVYPVFRSTAPQVVNDADWPVTVVTSGTSKVLSSPVMDGNVGVGRIFIGDGNGLLYAINVSSPAHVVSATETLGSVGAVGAGIVDPPLIISDPNNVVIDQVFASTGCSNVSGIAAAVDQLPANFTTGAAYQAESIGGSTGNSCPGSNAHTGTVDNAFWTSGFTAGHMIACGFTSCGSGSGGCPKMFEFPFLNNQITTASVSQKIDNNKGEECSPLTEFFDQTSDRIFFGTGGSTSASIKSFIANGTSITFTSVTAPAGLGGTSGIVIDNQLGNGGDNLYFTTLGRGDVNNTSCGTVTGGANAYCAVKLTQAALQ